MPDCAVVDTHVHLWDPRTFTYPWLADAPKLNRPFLLKDYDEACRTLHVEAIVFVQCEADFSQAMDEAKWVMKLAQDDARIKAIIPWIPLEKGDACRPFLDELKQSPLVKGVRRLLQSEADLEFCVQPDFIRGLQILAEYEFSFDICISHVQMANTIRMVQQCPDVSFVLDHIGKPAIKGHVFEPWSRQIKTLSELPNVVCKMSGLITEADHENWTKEDLKPYVDHVVRCFGFDRLMYGGDWPVVTMAGRYTQWLDALEWAIGGCSPHENMRLFHDNAVHVYRIS